MAFTIGQGFRFRRRPFPPIRASEGGGGLLVWLSDHRRRRARCWRSEGELSSRSVAAVAGATATFGEIGSKKGGALRRVPPASTACLEDPTTFRPDTAVSVQFHGPGGRAKDLSDDADCPIDHQTRRWRSPNISPPSPGPKPAPSACKTLDPYTRAMTAIGSVVCARLTGAVQGNSLPIPRLSDAIKQYVFFFFFITYFVSRIAL